MNSVKKKWLYINEYTKKNQVNFDSIDIFDKFLYQAKAGAKVADEHPTYSKLGVMFAKEKGTPIYDSIIDEVVMTQQIC